MFLGYSSLLRGAVYVTGSVSTATTNVALQRSESQYGSASLDMDLGRYVRIGYTYGVEVSRMKGYKDPTANESTGAADPEYCSNTCASVYTNEKVVSHSLGLTLVLYEGQIFMPFIMGGGMFKIVTLDSVDIDPRDPSQLKHTRSITPIPGPYAGAGMGIRINREFSLKFTYQISQGMVRQLGDSEIKRVWDPKTTVGLSYQL